MSGIPNAGGQQYPVGTGGISYFPQTPADKQLIAGAVGAQMPAYPFSPGISPGTEFPSRTPINQVPAGTQGSQTSGSTYVLSGKPGFQPTSTATGFPGVVPGVQITSGAQGVPLPGNVGQLYPMTQLPGGGNLLGGGSYPMILTNAGSQYPGSGSLPPGTYISTSDRMNPTGINIPGTTVIGSGAGIQPSSTGTLTSDQIGRTITQIPGYGVYRPAISPSGIQNGPVQGSPVYLPGTQIVNGQQVSTGMLSGLPGGPYTSSLPTGAQMPIGSPYLPSGGSGGQILTTQGSPYLPSSGPGGQILTQGKLFGKKNN